MVPEGFRSRYARVRANARKFAYKPTYKQFKTSLITLENLGYIIFFIFCINIWFLTFFFRLNFFSKNSDWVEGRCLASTSLCPARS